jgi:drug/metabolite transporter (DMT)-like permease
VLLQRAQIPAARRGDRDQLRNAILVIILAVAFLGERMTRPRIALVLAGIAGMFLIVRPGSVVFQGAALLALGSAVFYGTFQILTRMLAGEDSRVLLFYPALHRAR